MSWLIRLIHDVNDLQIGIVDIVDILTVAILIYALLVLLRGSRAVQILWGISVLYLLAVMFELVTLSAVLKTALVFLPIAMVILFQNEIRRMLMALVPSSWTRLAGNNDEGEVMLNELSLAAQALASKRIGALIAIERRDSLELWTDTGIPLEARFSYDLILNIFIPGTPLHDGAVIVRSGRLAAASCFLPLTTRHALSTELGTRHRAAIGLSEETDALVVVVSEETGTISLAVEGQLLRPLDETTLRNALAENLYQLGHGLDEGAL
jgi:diadenylate cyclase